MRRLFKGGRAEWNENSEDGEPDQAKHNEQCHHREDAFLKDGDG